MAPVNPQGKRNQRALEAAAAAVREWPVVAEEVYQSPRGTVTIRLTERRDPGREEPTPGAAGDVTRLEV